MNQVGACSARGALLSAPTQALAGEVVVLHNITEEVALDRAKTNLIAMISHELRTPLRKSNRATGHRTMEEEAWLLKGPRRPNGCLEIIVALSPQAARR